MKLIHEDLIYAFMVAAATLLALVFSIAIFSTESWAIGGKLAMFGVVALVWCIAMIPTAILFFEKRDDRVRAEKERWEAAEHRRLERAQLEEKVHRG